MEKLCKQLRSLVLRHQTCVEQITSLTSSRVLPG